ncbi:Cytochrome P450 [Canna indica]|uniref:Cytochrome P450 n=1 Tax=Canna indica TaxID=4628 RepID=A0AAQ3Q2A8_9LILI|nr:Cytochrome P450 [Canna indica]
MSSLGLVVLIPTTILFLILFHSFRRYAKKKDHNIPPGDMGWPLVGETFSFMKPHLSTTVGGFMEQHTTRFGKIFLSNLFGAPTVISAEPELNRFLFKNDTRLFEPGWPRSFADIVGRSSISFLVGDAHKHMRSIILDFLSAERIRTFFLQDMDYLASILLGSWTEGSVISSLDEATKFSFYIMVKNILSIGPEDPQIEWLRGEFNTFTKGLISFPLKIPGMAYWRGLQSRRNLLELLNQEITKRTKEGDNTNERTKKDDFLGWVIKNTDYSLEKIGDLMLHTLFAAHDTTSRAISLMIYFLDSSPEIIAHLREEHVGVLNSRRQNEESNLTFEDYKSMEFTQCVINETLRLGNIVSHIQRKVSADVHYKGYLILKGYNIAAHLSAVHLDPSLFEDPHHFNPWRWLCSSGVKKTNDFMPFGGGARHCPGSEIARLEMAVFLHHLILKHDWVVAEPDHPICVPYVDFAKGLPIKVRAFIL